MSQESHRRSSDARCAEDMSSLNSTATRFVGSRPKPWMISSPSTSTAPNQPKRIFDYVRIRNNISNPGIDTPTKRNAAIDSQPRTQEQEPTPINDPSPISPVSVSNDGRRRSLPSTYSPFFPAIQTGNNINTTTPENPNTSILPSPSLSHGSFTRNISEIVNGTEAAHPAAVNPTPTRYTPIDDRSEGPGRNPSSTSQLPASSLAENTSHFCHENQHQRPCSGSYQHAHASTTQSFAHIQPPISQTNRISDMHRLINHPYPHHTSSFIPWLPTSNGTLENSRVSLLRLACERNDYFYLALHQIFCLRSTALWNSCFLRGYGQLEDQGMAIISKLLLPNSSFNPMFVELCCRFPGPLEQLQRWGIYANSIEHFLRVLASLATHYEFFENVMETRGYPPLIHEMVASLGISSATLQRIIFTSICRRILDYPDESWLHKYSSLFYVDQENNRHFPMTSTDPNIFQQAQRKCESVAFLYKQLRSQVLRVPQTLSTPAPVPSFQHQPPTAGPQLARPPPSSTTQCIQMPTRPIFEASASPVLQTPVSSSAPRFPPGDPRRSAPNYPRPGRNPRRGGAGPYPNAIPNRQVRHTQINTRHTQPILPPTHSSNSTPLLPPPNFIPTELASPDPNVVGLHEAHLRTVTKYVGAHSVTNMAVKMYQYLLRFAITPSSLGSQTSLFNWKFIVTPEQFDRLPTRLENKGVTVWGVVDGSLTYQVRCAKLASDAPDLSEHEWVASDTAWPTFIYLHVNGIEHFVRRKVHNGRDLPVDITKSIKKGDNEISVALMRNNADYSLPFYAIAVEVLDNAVHERAFHSVHSLDIGQSLDRIRKKFSSSSVDDEEITVIDNYITVDLIDPFTARMFDTPARSKHCAHTECFDLETFFNTRLSKATKGQGMAEDWKCPICGKDARPQALVIDKFLVEVRSQLAARNELNSKAIHVRADGTWQPKSITSGQNNSAANDKNTPSGPKARNGNESGQNGESQLSTSPVRKSLPDVIELD